MFDKEVRTDTCCNHRYQSFRPTNSCYNCCYSAFFFAHRTLDPFLPSAHTSGRVSIIILLYALYSVESAICGAFSVHVSVCVRGN